MIYTQALCVCGRLRDEAAFLFQTTQIIVMATHVLYVRFPILLRWLLLT